MGIIKVRLTIKSSTNRSKIMVGNFLVDTGAHYTLLPENFVKKLGITPSFEQEFVLADGKTIKRKIGAAIVNFQGKELPVPVILGEKDDDALLGVTTLENLGLKIDPFNRTIYSSKLMLA